MAAGIRRTGPVGVAAQIPQSEPSLRKVRYTGREQSCMMDVRWRKAQASSVFGPGSDPSMREARVNGRLVITGPEAPESGVYPDRGGKVRRRWRKRMRSGAMDFYRRGYGEGKKPRIQCIGRYDDA